MKRYFITGTDTDCGKTYVTCALLNQFCAKGKPSTAIKPVATGGRISEDELLYPASLDVGLPKPYRFLRPISPHIAAKEEGDLISLKGILDYCNHPKFSELEILLIEGAGGLMAPLNEEETWLDFLTLSQIPVLFVVGMRLGCLNQTLLNHEVIEATSIKCVGWIANCLSKEMLALSENIAYLSKKITWPLLGILPYAGKFEQPIVL